MKVNYKVVVNTPDVVLTADWKDRDHHEGYSTAKSPLTASLGPFLR